MKRLVIITTILLVAAGYITIAYFKNLNPPGSSTNQVISNIPGNAAVILEYAHEQSLYDIFSGNQLPAAVLGQHTLAELDTVRYTFIRNTDLRPYFSGQNLFISIHPTTGNSLDYLLTIAVKKGFNTDIINSIAKKTNSGMLITPLKLGGKSGYTIFFKSIQKRFFIIDKGNNIFAGSFSRSLTELSATHNNKPHGYALLPAQQNTNALANLYVKYRELNNLYKTFFKYDYGMFREFRLLPATAVLSLNYKSDALMFNGLTTMGKNSGSSYLSLFLKQAPVKNKLKNIFPSSTAWFANFALSDIKGYASALSAWHNAINAGAETQLINNIQNETGVNIKQVFNEALSNEFAVINTRYQEKIGLVALKNGDRLASAIMSISSPLSDNSGRFNYDKLPYFLLGDSFEVFRRPYFMIVDNYLILANSYKEIESYYESYINRKFLVKMNEYSLFDNLMSQRSNVFFYADMANIKSVFKRDMNKEAFRAFDNNSPGWKDISGVSYQLTASGGSFYTNFCIGMLKDEAFASKIN